ncbi:MAG TPA: hypothetical protein VHO04_13055 [Sphingopyxis sp.]|uniref:hypothetical protein n=1 Tax=Sphingopyxis sp. TaxID=1908224 RepID=UPI002E316D47|nr:hypothetical protein [Sphingopyxis sp.]HEX2813600.1 hypothetical protein [Sphingopyxis sp.]
MSHSIGMRRRLNFFDEVCAATDQQARPALRRPRGHFYRLTFLGAFQLIAPDGNRIEIGSKKAVALLALLATAPTGERWRSWIQERLWGSLEIPRAQAGLRRELHRLRKLTSPYGVSLLHSDFRTVRLNLVAAEADVRHNIAPNAAEFLEGLDLSGEDNFEDWLREMRCNLADCPTAVDKNRMLKDAEYEDNRLLMVMRELPAKRNFT